MLTRKCQKTQKIDENINIERENLNIFWTTWGTLMKFSGKMWLNIKSHKKTRLHFVGRKCKFGKSYKYCQIWSKRTLSEISEFSILGIEQNRKLGNLGSFLCFFLIHFITLSFCFSSFLSFLNLKLQLLSKFEKNTFRDLRVFNFECKAKSKTRKFSFFLLKSYRDL